MIKYDAERKTVFGPCDLKLDGKPNKCLLVFDGEIWEDYVLPNKNLETFPVKNAFGRVFDTYCIGYNNPFFRHIIPNYMS